MKSDGCSDGSLKTIKSGFDFGDRCHTTVEGECIRVKIPLNREDARRFLADFVAHYNEVRAQSAIGYIMLADMLTGREAAILTERDRKLHAAHERRRTAREAVRARV